MGWPGFVRRKADQVTGALGGRRKRDAVLALGAVMALDAADRSALGVLAPHIKAAFGVGNTAIGVLAGAFGVVAALATLPAGLLTDRVRRVGLLTGSVVLWSLAMGVGAAAVSFLMLAVSRLGLGVVSGTGGPTISSLLGDLFPPERRSRILSWIRSGELVGGGVGLVLGGIVLLVLSWRGVFAALALVGVSTALLLRSVDEPERGGTTRAPGAPDRSGATGERAGRARGAQATAPASGGGAGASEVPGDELAELVREIPPDPDLVVHGRRSERSLGWAARYVLRVRTDVVLIFAGTIGDFFFAGLQTFGVVFVVQQYGVPKDWSPWVLLVAGGGALAGLVLGGRIADALLDRGVTDSRIVVSVIGFLAGALVLLPAVLTRRIEVALPFLVLAGALLAAPNPSLDAARLDVVDPRLWGRAEGIRTAVRVAGQAVAPVVFGVLSDTLAGGGRAGLQRTFLIMLGALAANGLVLLVARRTYPRDVASALAGYRGGSSRTTSPGSLS